MTLDNLKSELHVKLAADDVELELVRVQAFDDDLLEIELNEVRF